MRIGLAQTKFPASMDEGIDIVKQGMKEAAESRCDLVCFPESILPGLRGVGYPVEEYNQEKQRKAIELISSLAREYKVAVILPTEWMDELGYHLVAFVISEEGEILGYQTKNQIAPDEDQFGYVAGNGREIFEIKNVKFGIVICHEGWRYPETVRWAALQEAAIVFHPQFTGVVNQPEFYQVAMVCRAAENNLYFASVNYCLENQGCSTSLISPSGERLSMLTPSTEGLLVWDIDPNEAHRLLAKRFKPELLG
ncbi:carbon-nitrogen hydrolase family protein [Ammoniphilus sp. CFH 90114]|uniref:carbon-nitrogen hydrolase family protein n=1 Tax=Ammoniphilus sp. CFH 90114 TaxID=2493665 RepID=UPI00100EDAA6|nr:carbon-nitrogen hydrolase family protein [Ammoniphilus sp. CFH 90114]RXT05778.1 carbon-nitrogen hydrolase family protein [Ammoniphilus sp. CFH 90114]